MAEEATLRRGTSTYGIVSSLNLTVLCESALPFTLCDHVARDNVTHDARDEHVSAGLGDQPAAPLQLVECGVERVSRELRGTADPRSRHALAQDRRGDQRLLRRSRETTEVHANRG